MKKLFSEFASCWGGGGATVTPAAEEHHDRRRSKRTAKGSGAAANWKPKLNAISENSSMSEAAAAHKRRPVKAKPKSPASLSEDYWKYSQTMALPAFAPTSYLF